MRIIPSLEMISYYSRLTLGHTSKCIGPSDGGGSALCIINLLNLETSSALEAHRFQGGRRSSITTETRESPYIIINDRRMMSLTLERSDS